MKFLENKYSRWYQQLIFAARCRINKPDYYELHHVTPKSMGGSDADENLVALSAREHFVAHLLLTKMTHGADRKKMTFALSLMLVSSNPKLKHRHLPTSRWYEYNRRLLSETQRGRIFSEETRRKMSLAAIERFKDPKARTNVSSWTRNPSSETRKKIGEAARNRTNDALEKMRKAKSRKCTIDGVTIFPSKKELAKHLGWGKNGAGSKTFRFI